eukprot:TRINITY_DN9123_c0_g1_i5.p1 TRINITY_DN9123_c0_g1~~TRINITY_DN9123_c0_g1_i5.p1  ORF type:complete len:491 (+),score=106.06 TRINITY_DN9123_c0_g1_i5:164-1636(+)
MDKENTHPQLMAAMSPVSSLSHSLSGMKAFPSRAVVNTSVSPSQSPPSVLSRFKRQQESTTRRRLSISYDSIMMSSTPSPAADTPSNTLRSLSFSSPAPIPIRSLDSTSPDSTFMPAGRPSLSPYKTPKRSSTDSDDEDNDNNEDEDDTPPNSPSAKHTYRQDIRMREKSLSQPDITMPSSLPAHLPPILRRSSSDLESFPKRRPRPWATMSMSFAPETDHEMFKRTRLEVAEALPLPTVPGSHADLNCIDPSTVADLIDGRYSEIYSEIFIIDCRFPYEYEGGHIRGAINLTENQVKERFIDHPVADRRICLVFHCEFSSKRAPSSLKFLRGLDRKVNLHQYPNLYYNDVFLLEGGYKKFFEDRRTHCEGGYVLMRDDNYAGEMKDHIRQRAGLKRSRSFSFSHLSSTSILCNNTVNYGVAPLVTSSTAPDLTTTSSSSSSSDTSSSSSSTSTTMAAAGPPRFHQPTTIPCGRGIVRSSLSQSQLIIDH